MNATPTQMPNDPLVDTPTVDKPADNNSFDLDDLL